MFCRSCGEEDDLSGDVLEVGCCHCDYCTGCEKCTIYAGQLYCHTCLTLPLSIAEMQSHLPQFMETISRRRFCSFGNCLDLRKSLVHLVASLHPILGGGKDTHKLISEYLVPPGLVIFEEKKTKLPRIDHQWCFHENNLCIIFLHVQEDGSWFIEPLLSFYLKRSTEISNRNPEDIVVLGQDKMVDLFSCPAHWANWGGLRIERTAEYASVLRNCSTTKK